MPAPLRVVFAEDGDLLRAGISALLESFDDVTLAGVAATHDDLLALVDTVDPDVVLTDVRMPPDFTDEGIRAARTLRRTRPQLGVVVLTQYADVEYALDLLAEGSQGRGYLLKERVGHPRELVDALRTVAAGGSVIDEAVVTPLVTAGARHPGSALGRLTPRELEVLTHVARGFSNRGIAERLVVSERGVEKHINSILGKLDLGGDSHVHRRVAAALVLLNEVGMAGSWGAAANERR